MHEYACQLEVRNLSSSPRVADSLCGSPAIVSVPSERERRKKSDKYRPQKATKLQESSRLFCNHKYSVTVAWLWLYHTPRVSRQFSNSNQYHWKVMIKSQSTQNAGSVREGVARTCCQLRRLPGSAGCDTRGHSLSENTKLQEVGPAANSLQLWINYLMLGFAWKRALGRAHRRRSTGGRQ